MNDPTHHGLDQVAAAAADVAERISAAGLINLAEVYAEACCEVVRAIHDRQRVNGRGDYIALEDAPEYVRTRDAREAARVQLDNAIVRALG